MTDLRLSLEDGFAQDHLVVTVDDETVLDEAEVTTRMQTGLATTVDVPVAETTGSTVPAGGNVVRVSLPDRGIEGDLTVDAAATPYVRISINGDRVELTATDSPPFYA
jgi:hypothetical protein